MRKKILFLTLLIFATTSGFTQNGILKPNSISIELGGPAVYGSVNYDRSITTKRDRSIGILVGIGISPAFGSGDFPIVPVQIKVFKQLQNHTILVGTAFTPFIESLAKEIYGTINVSVSGYLGYNYSFNNGFFLGTAFTPVLNTAENTNIELEPRVWGALRFGYRF